MSNIKQYIGSLENLTLNTALGYIDSDTAIKIDKFSRVNAPNGDIVLFSSFNNDNPFLDTPAELFLNSTSASDTFEVEIQYLYQNRDIQTVTKTLTGTTNVSLGTNVYCVFRMFNNNGIDQVGTINIKNGGGSIFCQMALLTNNFPSNQSLTGIFSVPRGYIALITNASITADKGMDLKGVALTRQLGGVFRFTKALSSFQAQSSFYDLFLIADEKTDFKPIAYAQIGGIAYLDYQILLLKKDSIGKNFKI